MNYRSKRTRAQLMESQVASSLKKSTVASFGPDSTIRPDSTIGPASTLERWGPFCPEKGQQPSPQIDHQPPTAPRHQPSSATKDAEGNYQKIMDSIQPYDVWHANGVKYFVTFNEFYQPLRKGGHILVRFIGDIAKTERFCPIRETNWRHVNAQYKVDIIKLVRDHFVLPDGDSFDEGILKRVGKSVRQYRHYLKNIFFKPMSKKREEIYQSGPAGHPRDSWIHLVDYWYSEKGKSFSECGKAARSSQNHVHTTGSTSYANIRADFEEKNNRDPSELEIFKQTHLKKDGTFVENTFTEDLLDDADADVHYQTLFNPTKTLLQMENEAFSKQLYGGEVPKRPLGYGFGVKQSDVFGVRGILRKESFNCALKKSLASENVENIVASLIKKNEVLEKQNEELRTTCYANNNLLKRVTGQFTQILDVVNSGNVSNEFLHLTKTVLQMGNAQVPDSPNGQRESDEREAK